MSHICGDPNSPCDQDCAGRAYESKDREAYRRGVDDALEAVEKVLMQSIPEDAPLLNGEIGRSEAYGLVRGIRKQLLG